MMITNIITKNINNNWDSNSDLSDYKVHTVKSLD